MTGAGAPQRMRRERYTMRSARPGAISSIQPTSTRTGQANRSSASLWKGHHQSVVLATKYTNAFPGTDPNAAGNQRKNMMQAVEASLKRLKTDYIDLYWVHIWDQLTPVEEVMRGLDDLVRAGKVLYTGISDAPAWWIAQANTLAHFRGWSPFVGLQIEYSLIERTVERELIPMASALNNGVTAWAPMALAWLRYRPMPVIPIVGARKLSQFEDNLASFDLTLSSDQLKTLDEASVIELGFPYEMYAKAMPRAICYGGLRDQILA